MANVSEETLRNLQASGLPVDRMVDVTGGFIYDAGKGRKMQALGYELDTQSDAVLYQVAFELDELATRVGRPLALVYYYPFTVQDVEEEVLYLPADGTALQLSQGRYALLLEVEGEEMPIRSEPFEIAASGTLHVTFDAEQLMEGRKQLTSTFAKRYHLIVDDTLRIPLSFAYEYVYPLQVETDGLVEVTQDENELLLCSREEGYATISISDGQTSYSFTVYCFQEPAGLEGCDQALGDGIYKLLLREGEQRRISVQKNGTQSIPFSVSYNKTYVDILIDSNAFEVNALHAGATSLEVKIWLSEDEVFYLIGEIDVEVVPEWHLSTESVYVEDEDTSEVLIQLLQALVQLDALRGDPMVLAQAGYTEKVAEAVSSLKKQFAQEGFSEGNACSRTDYLRILDLAQERRQNEQTAAATPAPTVQKLHVQGDYQIISAAQTTDGLYLLDQGGSLIQYDPVSGAVKQVSETMPYVALYGNGRGALAVDKLCGIKPLGQTELDLSDLGSIEQPLAQMALAEHSVLVVLGPESYFAVGDEEDTLVGEGYGVYWKAQITGKERQALQPSAVIDSNRKPLDGIFLVAGGGENVVLARKNSKGEIELYAKSTQKTGNFTRATGYSMGNDTNYFERLKLRMPDQEQLNPVALAISSDALAVVQRNGTVLIAGPNDAGQLGVGDRKQRNAQFARMLLDDQTPVSDVCQVLLMPQLTFCLTRDGNVYVAGAADDGYTHPLDGISDISSITRLNDETIMLLNEKGQWMQLALPELSHTNFATVND